MSGRRAKKQRKAEQAMSEFLKPLLPLHREAAAQTGNDEKEFADWLVLAASAHNLRPAIPLSDLLPDQLDKTIGGLGSDFEDELDELLADLE